ncbi:hypothetical protein EPUS_06301 [Endocarpon pusillum Z07020]|uniref:Uncharacterized protein n=1 Tax=Endocarpon pusillum (strain Z07020 / HMAS-L-300199) TaxID=1263415 RepID=U1GX44_ENDPU|nr:uncharacterized protein EPUS_06301 [Endocarpon pusillum Z07020]ERF77083.1 hypothetical protein EPUS_06301 [Endocarpon pusillum Z07020]
MSSPPNITQSPSDIATPSPPLPCILKRKAATEKDMFKPNKRPAYSTPQKSNFAQPYQEEQRKVQNDLPMCPDILNDIVIPTRVIPAGIKHPFAQKVVAGDETKMYRWAEKHRDKAHVRQNKHLSPEERERVTARFPKQKAAKTEERKARVPENAEFIRAIDVSITALHDKLYKTGWTKHETKEEVQAAKFLHRCWKELKVAAVFQHGSFEHKDLDRYGLVFSDYWHEVDNKDNAKFWIPRWTKDKTHGRLVLGWQYLRN